MLFLPIVFTCDDKYFKYANVAITSIIKNNVPNCFYEINIISEYISIENKQKAQKQIKNHKNFSLNFIDLKKIDTDKFHLNSYMSVSTYYRFFIPELFKDYERVLYLDCDLIIDADISNLATIDFIQNGEEKLIMACKDPYIQAILTGEQTHDKINKEYLTNILKLSESFEYFNAGVMLYNIKEINKNNVSELIFKSLDEIKSPLLQDQDLLNYVFLGKIRGGGKIFKQ